MNNEKLWTHIMMGEQTLPGTKTQLNNGKYPRRNKPHWWTAEMTAEVTHREDVCNLLPAVMRNSVAALCDYFNEEPSVTAQIISDLFRAKFRLFDAIAMWVQSDMANYTTVKIMAWEFIHSGLDEILWQKNIVATDYDVNRKWETILEDYGG